MTQRSILDGLLHQPVDAPLRFALRVATVPIWLALSVLSVFVVMFVPLGLPNWLGNLLFFGPQLLSFGGIVRITASGHDRLFPDGTAGYVFAAFWLAIAIVHFAITRRWKLSHAFAMGLVVVVVAGLLKNLIFSSLGYHFELDGP